jgi:hypothetical protein
MKGMALGKSLARPNLFRAELSLVIGLTTTSYLTYLCRAEVDFFFLYFYNIMTYNNMNIVINAFKNNDLVYKKQN